MSALSEVKKENAEPVSAAGQHWRKNTEGWETGLEGEAD